VGELARRERDATSGGAYCTHHAIWIPVTVVWSRGDAAGCVGGRPAVATSFGSETKGTGPIQQMLHRR